MWQVQNVVCSGNSVRFSALFNTPHTHYKIVQGFLIDLHGLQKEFPRAVNLDLHLFPGFVGVYGCVCVLTQESGPVFAFAILNNSSGCVASVYKIQNGLQLSTFSERVRA